ncbi:O-methyltransferase [Crucibulum laeve]|uniref:O-methyltransferase n=1 Tax=Crucibulum laeve TaxID=68775 RepID=A0A5C3LP98_9AGAR|nr:O-methyltransferase [Crucibulum laeve]
MASTLIDLASLISSSVESINTRCKILSTEFPSLDQAPQNEHEDHIRQDPDVVYATSVAVAAAYQLIATIQPPAKTLLMSSQQFLISAALGVVNDSSTSEIMTEAGPEGIHVSEIAKKINMNPRKLARLLRPLATHHIFREVSPNVFAHNRVSYCMDTRKRSKAILERPDEKYQAAEGISALVGINTDETMKAAAYLSDTLLKNAHNEAEEFNTPLNTAFDTRGDLFSWYERDENKLRFKRFSMAMKATTKLSPPDSILRGFSWDSLPADSVVVDVGGGIGSVSLQIMTAVPKLRIIVQDRPHTLIEAEQYWKTQLPIAVEEERVQFEGHDFFEPQPARKVDVFLLRYITHDWSDEFAQKILQHLRNAAQPSTKLVINDYVIPYACHSEEQDHFTPLAPPKPLLPNFGAASAHPYMVDLQMMSILNGQERTIDEFIDLFARSGWKLETVYRPTQSREQLLAYPI